MKKKAGLRRVKVRTELANAEILAPAICELKQLRRKRIAIHAVVKQRDWKEGRAVGFGCGVARCT
jgi:hypothetical protein